MADYKFIVFLDDEPHASGYGTSRKAAEREAAHYAMMYDGWVRVEIRKCPVRKPKRKK